MMRCTCVYNALQIYNAKCHGGGGGGGGVGGGVLS